MSASADQAWRPRLVALDIDGTLVDRNGLLPRAVAEAVELVIQAGVPVVLSTGRSWHGTRPIFDELSLPAGPTVCSNGAVVVRYPPQEIVKAITFDPRPVITQVEQFAPGTLIAVEEIGIGYRLNSRHPGEDLTGELIIEDAEHVDVGIVLFVECANQLLAGVVGADEDGCAVEPT